MTKLKAVIHPIRKEFRRERCGCDHEPADEFFKSQWQSCTRSTAYLIYRWIIALFFTGVVIESMIDPDDSSNFWLYFIYMTNWGIILCMLTNLFVAVLVSIWHFHPQYADKLLNMKSLTSPFRIYWGMHLITLVVSMVITTIYWSVLYDAAEDGLSATNIMTHAMNSIIMFIDLWIVAHPMRLLHMFLPVIFGIIYAIFSLIYQLSGGVNKKGKPYIYHVIDWSKPEKATLTIVGVLLLSCCIYMLLFAIYRLRILLHRHCRKATLVLPTTTPATSNTKTKEPVCEETLKPSGIQHTPSGISMVLGNFTGFENKAFAGSKDSLPK